MNAMDALKDWLGRSEHRSDQISAAPIAALSATLDREDPIPVTGSEVPPLWHWLYFLPQTLQRDIGHDGHAQLGGFLPPVPLPRRMWAGGRLEFFHPLQVGDQVARMSRIMSVDVKDGRSGPLVFVCIRHEIAGSHGLALTEEHDIVYREAPAPGAPMPPPRAAPTNADASREIVPDPVLLFRYSALTFNGHRIHYDRSYVTDVEGYPGLVVHGPLIATLLMDLATRQAPRSRVSRFEFKALRPIFDIHRFSAHCRVDGNAMSLWASDHEGWLAMNARVEFA